MDEIVREYRGAQVPEEFQYGFLDLGHVLAGAWRRGVDAALASRQDIPAEVLAFKHVVQDNPNAARSIVRDMSGQDRAVLSFYLSELSRLVDDEELIRTAADRRASRPSHPDAI